DAGSSSAQRDSPRFLAGFARCRGRRRRATNCLGPGGLLLHAILLLQLLATPPEAHDAEALVHASMRDYDLGYFEQALREAEQAYRLYPLPQILFNIGQCHRALEHWERA